MKLIPSIYTHLFERDGKYYLFNASTNFFSEIGYALYCAILDWDWEAIPEDVLANLRERKIVVEEIAKYDYYNAAQIRFNAGNFDTTSMSLVIAPTTACNFNCPYCFESKAKPAVMTEEVMDGIVNFIKESGKVKQLHLTWYGGEPLLAFPQIQMLYNKLSAEGMPEIMSQAIITNGYLVDEKVCEFFKGKKLKYIQITLDGIKERHDKTRALKTNGEGTFDIICRNIRLIAERLPETRVNIRVNVDRETLDEYVKIAEMVKERFGDLPNVSAYPGFIREETPDNCTLCHKSIQLHERQKVHEHYAECGVRQPLFPSRKGKGCMIQAGNSYIIGPEGEIYKCWDDVSNEGRAVGSVFDKNLGSTPLLIRYMTSTVPFNDECRDCSVFPLCDGGCGLHRYRNVYENGRYELCSALRDKNTLENVLLKGLVTQFSEC